MGRGVLPGRHLSGVCLWVNRPLSAQMLKLIASAILMADVLCPGLPDIDEGQALYLAHHQVLSISRFHICHKIEKSADVLQHCGCSLLLGSQILIWSQRALKEWVSSTRQDHVRVFRFRHCRSISWGHPHITLLSDCLIGDLEKLSGQVSSYITVHQSCS